MVDDKWIKNTNLINHLSVGALEEVQGTGDNNIKNGSKFKPETIGAIVEDIEENPSFIHPFVFSTN